MPLESTITVKQLEVMGEHWENLEVKCDVRIDQVPGVMVASNGLQSVIDASQLKQWIGSCVADPEDGRFAGVDLGAPDHTCGAALTAASG